MSPEEKCPQVMHDRVIKELPSIDMPSEYPCC